MRARPHCFLEGTANVKLKSHWRWPKSHNFPLHTYMQKITSAR